jgi:hypothetical protein
VAEEIHPTVGDRSIRQKRKHTGRGASILAAGSFWILAA